ncbi:tetracycline repressor protein class H [Streptomyces tateyamensis]|uniref:Tetracycline repressor protein class H n=1 Tax=Streptomyces tateyamensis TaxID=565073 RepID=A0A2V4N673_9ACTN|nr:TetR/AcrR family transcriptional regulator C-terminal domain-containing protein [Streptomyces tateyamensis]PYC79507.1 tetracycline repressor protein class H [Streptomyces tateyamensis]
MSRQQVLDAALGLVDRDGLKGLTMRSLGEELGVEAMTLYHYVPNKDALLDGLVEQVFTAATPALDGAADWRTALHTYATALRAGLLRHPAVLPLAISRPAATPATLDEVEALLGLLTEAGFPLGRALNMLNSLAVFVIGHATAEARIVVGADEAGGADWIAAQAGGRYPLLVRAATDGAGTDDAERFAFALDALLLGFEALRPE